MYLPDGPSPRGVEGVLFFFSFSFIVEYIICPANLRDKSGTAIKKMGLWVLSEVVTVLVIGYDTLKTKLKCSGCPEIVAILGSIKARGLDQYILLQ